MIVEYNFYLLIASKMITRSLSKFYFVLVSFESVEDILMRDDNLFKLRSVSLNFYTILIFEFIKI